MDTKLMPRERLAQIVGDAAARHVMDVTGYVNPTSRRMTWSEQGVHAAAVNAIMHDGMVATALHMVAADGVAEYESIRSMTDPVAVLNPVPNLSVPMTAMMLLASQRGDAQVILDVLRQVWASVPIDSPDEKRAHLLAFDDALEEVRRRARIGSAF
ncbi:hypothetical protein SEA_FREGLEY_56 [Microbacterium phage Fregley]|nr:hypothetical protein SEA_FREGLEY_56 [Microbacterium phage Fregley]